ncbi:MFS transporter [Limnovirga soli]|uniref:MFS transporter n=1 Tax=Limnovirga soli TaxID=2656915 RepID=A0A8J8FGR6_9BACT|nr:MFS transporter [Limnovirga soli]NNV57836.1 MFS transporter [Limnovirga soli]
MIPTQEKRDPFTSVKIPAYRNLLAGRFLFIVGLRMLGTLVGWWIYELTNDPLAIGLIGLSEVIPAVSLALYAGHVIDQSEKRGLLLRGVVLYFLCACILLFLSSPYVTGIISNSYIALMVYGIIFCTGIIRSFTGPVFGVMMAAIVPKPVLQNAITWNQGVWLSASLTGHAVGGLLIAQIGIEHTLLVVCCLIFVSYFLLYTLNALPSLNEPGEKKTWDSVKEGLSFVFKSKEVLGALSLDLFAVLFGGAVAMIPVYARDILQVGAIGFGWLNAATDIGAIIIVIMLTIYPLQKQQGRKLFFAVAAFGTCIIIFALSKLFWLSFAALLVGGMVDAISVVIRGTILQLKTPDHMRGRVLSVNSMFINSSNELGQFESGVAAKIFGVIPSVIFGGSMTLLVVIITWFKAPSLRKMEY